jgi:hypothetical protein
VRETPNSHDSTVWPSQSFAWPQTRMVKRIIDLHAGRNK